MRNFDETLIYGDSPTTSHGDKLIKPIVAIGNVYVLKFNKEKRKQTSKTSHDGPKHVPHCRENLINIRYSSTIYDTMLLLYLCLIGQAP